MLNEYEEGFTGKSKLLPIVGGIGVILSIPFGLFWLIASLLG